MDTDLRARRLDAATTGVATYYSEEARDAPFGAHARPFYRLWAGSVFADLTDAGRQSHLPWVYHAVASAKRKLPLVVALLLTPTDVAEAVTAAARRIRKVGAVMVSAYTLLTAAYSSLYKERRRVCGE